MTDFLDGFPDEVEPVNSQLDLGPTCGRCYDEVASEDDLYPANCAEKPELLIDAPLGQYHCPDCGAMVLAGVEHPRLCKRCIDREHPSFDQPRTPA